MAVDKTIFECPVVTLVSQIDGGARLVMQGSATVLQDQGLPLSLLAQWINSAYSIGVYGGSTNPDPSLGNNGDLYFQSNGQIKQKVNGVWVFKTQLSFIPVKYRIPFTNQSTVNINWQTDTVPGSTNTYFTTFGNNVEAFVYGQGTPIGQPYTWTLDGSNNVNLVTFNFGLPQTGYIIF